MVVTEKDSAPRILFSGEDFLLEDLPVGTRVIYPRPPLAGRAQPEAAIRYALNHPEGMEPLHALLEPGMKVTIAVDDISLPLPPMATPDVRQTILEIVLEMLADHGVDDVHIIIANSLHRRMTDGGDEADGRRRRSSTRTSRTATTTTTPRIPTAWSTLGQDRPRRGGRDQPPRRRERPRHLREHQPRADGRRPQVGGRRPVRLREPRGAPQAEDDPRVRQLHGPEAVGAATRASSASAAWSTSTSRSSTSRPRSTTGCSTARPAFLDEERGRLHRGRPAEVPGA